MLEHPEQTVQDICRWIQNYIANINEDLSVVVGISGGKDSSVVAALCAKALGKDRVVGVMMPDGEQSDIQDARELIEFLGIPHLTVNIGECTRAFHQAISSADGFMELTGGVGVHANSRINLPPRVRMATLYFVAQSLPNGALVANTCNRSEDYVGYSTKFGDAAGDFSPLANLLVHEVRQIGTELGLPAHLVKKTPSDGLCGQTDEDKLGFSYDTLDHYILTGKCVDPSVKLKIDRLHRQNLHKLQLMPSFKP